MNWFKKDGVLTELFLVVGMGGTLFYISKEVHHENMLY